MIKITAQDITRRGGDPMGRFGGGWRWVVGVQVGRRSVILNLAVRQIRINWEKT